MSKKSSLTPPGQCLDRKAIDVGQHERRHIELLLPVVGGEPIHLLLRRGCTPGLAGEAFADVDGRLKISDNRRYLQYDSGKPFFYLGDTPGNCFIA